MAATKTITFGNTGTRPYGVLTVTETATSATANTSTVSVKLVLKRPSSISSTATKKATATVNGTTYSWSGSIGGSGDLTLINKTQTVTHNADGTKTISLSASITLDISWSGTQLGTISGSGTLALTAIPRYATVTQSNTAKTETTATMKWVSDSTVDYIWYSTNNGSTWSGINVADGKSGTYTISGLSANTAYKIKTRVRNKSSQLTTDSAALTVTTYAYPYANNMPSFTIGSKVTIGFYNPLGRSCTVNLIGADGSTLGTDTITGTTISGYNNATVQTRMYASIPNSASGTYTVKVTYGSNTTTKTGGKYTIDNAVCMPSIGAVSYKDVNTNTTGITGNNQQIVQNQSKVQYTATGLTAQKSATIKKCTVNVNGATYNLTLSGASATGGNAVINSGQDVQAVFTVTDSRGLTATKTVTVAMLALATPTAITTIQRQSNYYTPTDITVDADYSPVNNKNTITITYTATSDAGATVTGTLKDNVKATAQLDNNHAWTVVIILRDKFGLSNSYTYTVSRGIPIIYFDRLKSSVGVNCFPQDKQSLEVDGFNIARSIMTRGLGANVTTLTEKAYTKLPMTLSSSVGAKLTATSDGGIKIGTGVSKVLVSGRMRINASATAGTRYLRIIKNSYTNANTLGWVSYTLPASAQDSLTISPTLADVTAGDVLYMFYYVPASADTIVGGAYGGVTSMTIDVVG